MPSYEFISNYALESAATYEFRQRVDVRYFDACIYLGLKTGKWQQDKIIEIISQRPGYVKHKIIKYCMIWTHLYIKFYNKTLARDSVSYFNSLDPNLSCEISSTLLAQWYYFEKLADYQTHSTYAIVDCQGISNSSDFVNPLNIRTVQSVLEYFGNPRVVPSVDPKSSTVQAIFPTMAEALAASIALGSWSAEEPMGYYYMVRIAAGEKEAALIRDCLKSCDDLVEAFKLDYFVVQDESAWRDIKNLCSELCLQNESKYLVDPNLEPRALIGANQYIRTGFVQSSCGMATETPNPSDYCIPRMRVYEQTTTRRRPRPLYGNSNRSSTSQWNGSYETRSFKQNSDAGRRYSQSGSSNLQTSPAVWVNKEYKRNYRNPRTPKRDSFVQINENRLET